MRFDVCLSLLCIVVKSSIKFKIYSVNMRYASSCYKMLLIFNFFKSKIWNIT